MKGTYELCLGTAMWAWTIPQKMAYKLLDCWYENGERCIDTATNYPINKNPKDFRKAEQWLSEWIKKNGVKDLNIMVKVGSLSNDGSPKCNLSPSFLSINHQHYADLFGAQFDCMMFHWDNRDDKHEIQDSVHCMSELCSTNQSIGFSGIKHPEAYIPSLKSLDRKPWLQVKHNVFQSHLDYYKNILEHTSTIAYGLSGGGIKLKESAYNTSSSASERGVDLTLLDKKLESINSKLDNFNASNPDARVENMHQLGMLLASLDQRINGLLIGPSKTEHILDSIDFSKKINTFKAAYLSLKASIND